MGALASSHAALGRPLRDTLWGDIWIVSARSNALETAGCRLLEPEQALRVVTRLAQSAAAGSAASPAVGGRGSWRIACSRESFDARLAGMVRQGLVHLLVRETPWGGSAPAPSEPPPSTPIRPPAQTIRTWIGVRLLDTDDRPVPDERVVVVDPEGKRHPLVTDARGEARVESIVPGVCEAVLPDLDGRDWGPGGPSDHGDLRLEVSEHRHVARDGECFSSLARQKGFRRIRALLQDPENARLLAARQNPNILAEGDVIVVPDRLTRLEECPTAQVHTFHLAATTVLLRLRLAKMEADWSSWRLLVGNQEQCRGQLLGEPDAPVIVATIHADARQARLELEGDDRKTELALVLGELDPWNRKAGWIGRLRNLGYGASASSSSGELKRAISLFQRDHGLLADGEPGPQTLVALRDAHGC